MSPLGQAWNDGKTRQEGKGGRGGENIGEWWGREREDGKEQRREREHQKIGECVTDGRETN